MMPIGCHFITLNAASNFGTPDDAVRCHHRTRQFALQVDDGNDVALRGGEARERSGGPLQSIPMSRFSPSRT